MEKDCYYSVNAGIIPYNKIVRLIPTLNFVQHSVFKSGCEIVCYRLSDFECTLSASECEDDEENEDMEVNLPGTSGEMNFLAREVDEDMDVYGDENMEVFSVESDPIIEVQHGPETNEERYRNSKKK